MSYLQSPPPSPFNVGEKNVGEKEYIVYLTNIEWGGERGGDISHSLLMYAGHATLFIISILSVCYITV